MCVRGRWQRLVGRRTLDTSKLGERAIKLANLGRQREHNPFQIRVELIRTVQFSAQRLTPYEYTPQRQKFLEPIGGQLGISNRVLNVMAGRLAAIPS